MKSVALMFLTLSSVAMAKPAGDCWVEFGQKRVDTLVRQVYLELSLRNLSTIANC